MQAQPAVLGLLRPHLPAPLARALVSQGITQLYAHQVATVEALRAGKNVVLASPTASGKSLAFALPTLERVLTTPGTRALYLYPTKALIGDQLRALQALCDALGTSQRPRPRVAVLTGDTPRDERAELAADPPDILLANPDILHHSLLPDHRRWRHLLSNLGVVVVDELHSYRGVFGAHVSLVIRRLRRLAAQLWRAAGVRVRVGYDRQSCRAGRAGGRLALCRSARRRGGLGAAAVPFLATATAR